MTAVNMIALLVVIVGVSASLACMHGGGEKPPRPSCQMGKRCPEYTVDGEAMGYERRMYGPGMWVSTRMVGMDYRQASNEGFNRLFDYISGENEQNMKIAMTSPVVSRRVPNDDWTGFVMNQTMSFYVSSEYMADGPPMPTNPDVHIVRLPDMELYAREFSGYASEEMYLREAAALSSLLSDAGEPFQEGRFATAGYDSPMKPFSRRNEVWFAKLTI